MRYPGKTRVEIWFDEDELKLLDRVARREGVRGRAAAVRISVKIAVKQERLRLVTVKEEGK